MQRLSGSILISVLTITLAAAATAGTWGGHNGDIRLTFTQGPDYTHVMDAEPLPKAGIILDLFAYLSNVDQVTHDNAKYLSVGGWELMLAVDGAEWEIMETELPPDSINAGAKKGCLYVGKYTGIRFTDGEAPLARWRIRLHGDPKNVVFRLDPEGANSCATTAGCPGSGTHAIWTGSGAAGQVGVLFSAGYIPAYLNWEGEAPEVEPVRGEGTWQDTGLFILED